VDAIVETSMSSWNFRICRTTTARGLVVDANNRIATQSYPNGVIVKYVYTALGYLKEVRDNASNALYWRADSRDAEGHLLQQTYGNDFYTKQTWNAANGRVTSIVTGVQNIDRVMGYQYDAAGNLTSRSDSVAQPPAGAMQHTESFVYDSLNRLTSSTVNASGIGIVTKSYAYDALGNFTNKSDLGAYAYPASGAGSARPHAVSQVTLAAGGKITFAYDANGALTTQTQTNANNQVVAAKSRSQYYTSFNMPQSMAQGTISAAFYYGPEHQRVKQISSVQGTTIYLNPDNNGALFYEKDIKPDGSIQQRAFINAGGHAVAIVETMTAGGRTFSYTSYLHYDALGSVIGGTNQPIEWLAYEPFGMRRFPSGHSDPTVVIEPLTTNRGFTGHEMLDTIGLIHMNGRVYDPLVGRFLSADPYIQSPYNLQSYNRYSYVMNNPLGYTDPSGYLPGGFLGSLVGGIGDVLSGVGDVFSAAASASKSVLKNPVGRVVVTMVVAYVTGNYIGGLYSGAAANTVLNGGAAWTIAGTSISTTTGIISGASGGFAGGLVASNGNVEAALKGVVSGAMFGAINGYYGNQWGWERVGANTAAGAASAKIYGTNVLSGAAGSFITSVARWGYNSQVGYDANPLPGENRDYTSYMPDDNGRQPLDRIGMNVIGLNKELTGDFWEDFGKQGSLLSKTLNLIPGINATAGLHDYWFNSGLEFTPLNNVGTMLPAAAMTYAALLNGPLTVQMSGGRK
jgi:RHS repeat-associated protein